RTGSAAPPRCVTRWSGCRSLPSTRAGSTPRPPTSTSPCGSRSGELLPPLLQVGPLHVVATQPDRPVVRRHGGVAVPAPRQQLGADGGDAVAAGDVDPVQGLEPVGRTGGLGDGDRPGQPGPGR